MEKKTEIWFEIFIVYIKIAIANSQCFIIIIIWDRSHELFIINWKIE